MPTNIIDNIYILQREVDLSGLNSYCMHFILGHLRTQNDIEQELYKSSEYKTNILKK
jgi:hypothetical protein